MTTAPYARDLSDINPRIVRGVNRIAQLAATASRPLSAITTEQKDAALAALADALVERSGDIIAANTLDVEREREGGMSESLLDRLELDEERIAQIAAGVRDVIALADPVGTVVQGSTLPNGVRLVRRRVPLGVVGAIYEARPNVTVDIAALALKSGNAVILRGGSAARETNTVILEVIRRAISKAGMPEHAVQGIDQHGREGAWVLMQARDHVDLLIPRGGAELISHVVHHSLVPVIETGVGNVHMFLDASAKVSQSVDLVLNAKVQRPSVCNALETLLVHEKVAKRVLPKILSSLDAAGVVIHGDAQVSELAPEGIRIRRVTRRDWAREYLGLEIAISVVPGLDEAIEHIDTYSSGHTEVIVTNDMSSAETFTQAVDAAVVGVNVSTRFTDGAQFGLGAEVGISTQKLHARGPMGLADLTTTKWIMTGEGQIR